MILAEPELFQRLIKERLNQKEIYRPRQSRNFHNSFLSLPYLTLLVKTKGIIIHDPVSTRRLVEFFPRLLTDH